MISSEMLKSQPGTYALILQSHSNNTIQVGRWGLLTLQPGHYIYVGSAFGPGGVRARVSRHLRTDKPKRWHIDYLREFAIPVAIWVSYEEESLEHQWAQVFYDTKGMTPVQGFGCSDCKCYSHLFHTPITPDFTSFSNRINGTVELFVPVH
jgi:Uri superfamily endonuclease